MVSISELPTHWSGDSLIYHADSSMFCTEMQISVMQSYKIFSNRQYPRLLKMLGLMIYGIMGSNPIHLSSYEIIIGLPSNLVRFSTLSVGTLINNRFIARLEAT